MYTDDEKKDNPQLTTFFRDVLFSSISRETPYVFKRINAAAASAATPFDMNMNQYCSGGDRPLMFVIRRAANGIVTNRSLTGYGYNEIFRPTVLYSQVAALLEASAIIFYSGKIRTI